MSTEISAAAQALQRAMPVTRLLDCGMDYADAIALHARTAQGEPWDMAAEALAEAQFARAGQAERAGHPSPPAMRRKGDRLPAVRADGLQRRHAAQAAAVCTAERGHAAPGRAVGMPVERVELPFNGARLIGWLVRPARAARGTVIVFGGQSGWGMAYWPIARQLAARGLATLLAEGRARKHGWSSVSTWTWIWRRRIAALSIASWAIRRWAAPASGAIAWAACGPRRRRLPIRALPPAA